MLGPLWNVILDTEKLIFLNDKMLSSYTEENLHDVVQLSESLMMTQEERVGDKAGPFLRALVLALTRPSHPLRTRASTAVKKIINGTNGVDRSVALIAELNSFLEGVKIVSGSRNREETEGGGPTIVPLNEVDANSLVFCIRSLTSITKRDNPSCDRVALAAFKAAHFPGVVQIQPLCWYYIVKSYGLMPKTVIKRTYPQLKDMFIKNHKVGAWSESCLAGFLKLAPEEAIKDVLDAVGVVLSQEDLLRVSRDDYFIFRTPEGELYDRSVMENAKEDIALQNMKRESRVYSYQEQMEELQLRRELEEKRKREGKYKEPELNPKQKEAIRLQMEKEGAIRSKVSILNAAVQQACSMLRAALDSVPSILSNHLTKLIPEILRALSSPVAAPLLQPIWIDLRKVVFPAPIDLMAESIAHVTLRLVKPQCDLDPAWEMEPIDAASRRILAQLQRSSAKEPLDAPTFTYVFPFVRGTLKTLSSKEENLATQVYQIAYTFV